jgi:TPR repeat protein
MKNVLFLLISVLCSFHAIAQAVHEEDIMDALYKKGNNYLYGENGFPVNYYSAMECFLKVANSGDSKAQLQVGYMYALGLGVTQNDSISEMWYMKSADRHNAIALYNISYRYLYGKGGLEKDYKLAMKYAIASADSGYSFAQLTIGYMYSNGYGVEADKAIAEKWYRLAAAQKNDVALYDLGLLHFNGSIKGQPTDYDSAMNYFAEAAALGNSDAAFKIAWIYEKGLGNIRPDTDKAIKWYDMAAEKHNSAALNNYAWICYLRKANISKALRYSKESLDLYPSNINSLDTYAALLFLNKDYTEAEKYQKRALDGGGDKKGGFVERYGDILMKLKEKEEALKYWKMALELEGHSTLLPQKISKEKYLD